MRTGSPWFPLWKSSIGSVLLWTGYGLALVSLGWAVILLLRRNLMGIAGATDISSILLVVVLPTMFESVSHGSLLLLEKTPFVSRRGGEILGILFVVAWLHPVWELIERFLRYVITPKLYRIEKAVEHTLKAVVNAESEADRREQMSQLFEHLHITNYVVYLRGRDGIFDVRMNRMERSPVERLPLSAYLQEFLGGRRRFVDLEKVPLEWKFFFQQFELGRIQQATHCRYLLPICLGSNIRGLLLLPYGQHEEAICKDALAEQFTELGVAAINA
jgi:hypothetical protein